MKSILNADIIDVSLDFHSIQAVPSWGFLKHNAKENAEKTNVKSYKAADCVKCSQIHHKRRRRKKT